ncbi:hypothetical protein [Woodsholea maritima]|uniref:hypothetical protein n=1 Tax=Woodsholea maritima TaxID=240237 RepID=UPI00037D7CA9|nr:hypothetical protein [Woodsholea maritima]
MEIGDDVFVLPILSTGVVHALAHPNADIDVDPSPNITRYPIADLEKLPYKNSYMQDGFFHTLSAKQYTLKGQKIRKVEITQRKGPGSPRTARIIITNGDEVTIR